MKRLPLFLLLIATSLTSFAADRPRLAVVIVVDQMRPDMLTRFKPTGPMRKRLSSATVFTNAIHNHVPTETAPGHATIATGRPPSVHGVFSNEIFDRKSGAISSAVQDPKKGVGPFRLKARALADAVRAANPKSRVIALSLKDRAAIFLGGQKPHAAVWYDPDREQFVTSEYYGPLPKWVEPVNADIASMARNVTPPFAPNELRPSPAADRALLALSTRAIASEGLGADDACDLLLVSFSATDLIGHRWGPDSEQMRRQIDALDAALDSLLGAAEAASGGRMVAIITSDHGVLPLPEGPEGRKMGARRVLVKDFVADLEAALQHAHPATRRRWVSGIQLPDVYLNRALAEERKVPWQTLLKSAQREFPSVPGVAAVYLPGQPSDDPYSAVFLRSQVAGMSGDVQLRTAPGLLVSRWPTGTSHGTPYDYDAVVPAVFIGLGGKPARIERRISIESLAPTLAQALGLSFPAREAPLLPEALPPVSR